ncbi:methylosome subunit pICln-like [Mizuhopecten yessoensis]|uniref:Methylosome subunit pICln n=1 Tax=Mizuhopecten yessoensis TaxID=6573 RepID=A0A210R6Y3_MIZYE|nr:methylosome subunit pICln-like [Mizuhopecten yessoensis]OWF56704.1 Methylosome subunit pICln [Mizuhopecten yessoensis]
MVVLTTFSAPSELVRHKERDTVVNIDGTGYGNGTLFITETIVAWQNVEGKGFSLNYPKISLHALSRDTSAFPQECLYLMVEGKLPEEVDPSERQDSEEEEEEDESQVITEVRFVPSDKSSLQTMFSSMSDCQALHPDEQDTDSEAEAEEGMVYYDVDEGYDNLTLQGQATLQHLENLLISGQGDGQPSGEVPNGTNVPSEQFEDADEMDQ